MENIASHLKLAELKQRNLCKAHEQLHSQASSLLLFSLQWKDLELHFDSTRELIQRQYEELGEREKLISLKQKSIDECSKEFELKKNELSKLHNMIEKYDGEVRLKEKKLDTAHQKLGNLSSDIKLKEREVNMVCQRIEDVKKEFEHKEKVLCVLRKKIDDCEQEFELKEKKLNGVMQLIEERSVECVLKENVIESIGTLLQEQEEELATKRKQNDALQMAIKERSAELKLKEKELESIQNMVATILKEKRLDTIEKCIKSRTEELDFKEKELGLMQRKLKDLSEDLLFKESELESVKMCIKQHSKELDMLEKQLDSTQNSFLDSQNEVKLLAELISSIENSVIELFKDWESKENHCDSLQESVNSNGLSLVERVVTVKKCLESLKVQREHFYLLRKSIEDSSQKLKIKENELERQTVKLKMKDEKVSECLKEIESVRVEIASQMKLLEKCDEGQRLEEIQYEVHTEKLDSKEKDKDIMRTLMEKCTEKAKLIGNSNIFLMEVKNEESNCRPVNSSNTLNFHSGVATDGKFLLVLLCEHLKVHDLVRSELVIALQTSSQPAKLVLDAMTCFYPTHVVTGDTKFDVHNIKRGCIFLSELLLKVSPKITPPLKEEALKLAGQWKDKMTVAADNHLEVVAFLLLVANFGLSTDFNADDLQTLLNSVSHYKQEVELRKALGIADKSPVYSTNQYLVQMEQPESLQANKTPFSSLENEQCMCNSNEKRLYVLLNEQLTGHALMPSAILSTLKKSSNPAKLVLDVIQGLFYPLLKKKERGFEVNSLRWYTLLLKQLMNISYHIDPKVKEDAMRLAVDWKSNMRTDGNISLETVSFLEFLVSYGLTTSFSRDEIMKHFENILLHDQASDLCKQFGFTHQIHDLVKSLIGTKQFLRAVRFICGYKLDSFRPFDILNKYLQHARNATLKARNINESGQEEDDAIALDKEIGIVKSVITCIADCKLRPGKLSQSLENRLVKLEEMKTNKTTFESKDEPHLERRNQNSCQQPHPTNVETQQLPFINVESQQLNSTTTEQHQQYCNNFESRQPHPSDVEGQPPHLTEVDARQPYSMKAEMRQPHSIKVDAQPPRRKKRKNKQFQNSQLKYPRLSPSMRPGIPNSTPSVHCEKWKFQQHDARFVGMHGLEHGNQFLRPPWPRP